MDKKTALLNRANDALQLSSSILRDLALSGLLSDEVGDTILTISLIVADERKEIIEAMEEPKTTKTK